MWFEESDIQNGRILSGQSLNSKIFQFLHCQLLISFDWRPYTANIFKYSPCWRPARLFQVSYPILKHWHKYFIWDSLIQFLIILNDSLIIPIVSTNKCPSFKQNVINVHCECHSHTIYKSSIDGISLPTEQLHKRVCSCMCSKIWLVGRLHEVFTISFWKIQNGFLSRQTVYLSLIHTHTHKRVHEKFYTYQYFLLLLLVPLYLVPYKQLHPWEFKKKKKEKIL